MTTKTADTTFTVKEHGDGKPFIMLEGGEQKTFGKSIGFVLASGTTYEQAQDIARYMRQHLKKISMW